MVKEVEDLVDERTTKILNNQQTVSQGLGKAFTTLGQKVDELKK
jgi:hypothetical protein